jgi:glycosyltransferase involved in cell wall biosynthesis
MGSMESHINTKVSVITPTSRWGGIDILYYALEKQTYKNFELILVDSHYYKRKDEVKKFMSGIDVKHIPDPKKKKETAWNLNAAYNRAFKEASGDIYVFLQDYIWIPGDGLEKFVSHLLLLDKPDVVIGVGHKASYPSESKNPLGKITIFDKPFIDMPEGISEIDNRIDGSVGFVEQNYSFWELNWSSCRASLVKTLGGMDTEYDNGYGCENLNLSIRAMMLGAKFYIDKGNVCLGFNQLLHPRPSDWEARHNNKGFHQSVASRILDGEFPHKLKNI